MDEERWANDKKSLTHYLLPLTYYLSLCLFPVSYLLFTIY